MNDWNSPIYVFFKQIPRIEYILGCRCHIFECASGRCKARNGRDVRRFLDKGDRFSTSNLRKHAKACWGEDAVAVAGEARDVDGARDSLIKIKDGSITAEFRLLIGKGKVSYSTRQHTKAETR
jgi:hypothetical protein